MPSLTTHFIHSNEVLNKLNNETKNKIKDYIQIYNISSQSHDILFYNSKKIIKRLGHKAHHHNTQDFIINIIKNIKKYKLEEYGPAIAYLYGVINHYVLDTTCHPYIFYLTGVYKHNKETKKYKGLHTSIEKDIDSIYYKKYFNKEYKQCNISKEIIKNPILSPKLINLINDTYQNTYNIDNIGTIYNKTILKIKRIINIISNDKLGIKYYLYKIINIMSNNSLPSYSTYHPVNKELINIKEWYHPCTNIKNNTNFEDLFNLSITKSINIIEEVYKVIYNNQDINTLKEIIPNIDYSTSLDINNNLHMKYFYQ